MIMIFFFINGATKTYFFFSFSFFVVAKTVLRKVLEVVKLSSIHEYLQTSCSWHNILFSFTI